MGCGSSKITVVEPVKPSGLNGNEVSSNLFCYSIYDDFKYESINEILESRYSGYSMLKHMRKLTNRSVVPTTI